jgi:hypothetical protein
MLYLRSFVLNALALGMLSANSLLTASSTLADPIYRWESPDGSINYSSEAPGKNAKPADLPRITRGRLGLKPQATETCDNRGGVNCQSGADLDGSVICNDGYKEVKTPFSFYCNSPKLSVNDISEIKSNGHFSIFVRNSKAVSALKPEIILRVDNLRSGIILRGPEKIEPFEIGEFIYDPQQYGEISKKPTADQITLSCSNC